MPAHPAHHKVFSIDQPESRWPEGYRTMQPDWMDLLNTQRFSGHTNRGLIHCGGLLSWQNVTSWGRLISFKARRKKRRQMRWTNGLWLKCIDRFLSGWNRYTIWCKTLLKNTCVHVGTNAYLQFHSMTWKLSSNNYFKKESL